MTLTQGNTGAGSAPTVPAVPPASAAPVISDTRQIGAHMMFGGAGLLLLGSFLPWAKISLGRAGSRTVGGMEGDGVITLVMAAALALLARGHMSKGWSRSRLSGAVSCAAIALVATLVDLKDIGRLAHVGIPDFGLEITVGVGLWIAAVGSAAALAGAILALRAKPSA